MNAALSLSLFALLAGAAEWQPFAPKGASFRVVMPGRPEENQQTIKQEKGAIEIRFYTLNTKEGTYVVGMTVHPEGAVPAGQDQNRLDQARDGAVAAAKGRLRWERRITVDDRPGREIFVAGNMTAHNMKARLFADKNRLYQVMVVGSTRFLDSPEAVRFLDSFRLAK